MAAVMETELDIDSALSSAAGSRKLLRKFCASLGLSIDDGLSELLSQDEAAVDEALRGVFGGKASEVRARLDECRDGVGSLAATPAPSTARSVAAVRRAAPGPAAAVGAGCCVECGAATDYVFALLGVRLCQGCERRCPKYALVTRGLASRAHALGDWDLDSLRSLDLDGKACFLRTDVEAVATGRETTAKLREQSAREWRSQSFKTDHRGKTHKWKQLNTATFQKQRANRKHRGDAECDDVDVSTDCMDLSGLVRAPPPA